MILHCNNADEGCGLPGDEGIIEEKCGKSADEVAGTVLSRRGLFTARAIGSFSTAPRQCEDDTSRTGSSRRRIWRWFRLDRSPEQKVMAVHFLGRELPYPVNVHNLAVSAPAENTLSLLKSVKCKMRLHLFPAGPG